MKNIIVLLNLLMLFSYSIQAQNGKIDIRDKRLKNLDKELSQVLTDFNAVGFAVAIVEKDQVIYAKGFGYRDYERKIQTDANTLFPIGSCSKAFTAAIMGNLQSEGRLSFKDSPLNYLPRMKFFSNEMNNQINLRDMMSHRTGLPRHDLSWYLFPSNSADELLERIKYQEPSVGIRERWQYNNFMYMVQGMIAKSITGKSWAENIKDQFFGPLQMNRSNTSIEDLKKDENHSIGYMLDEDKHHQQMPFRYIVGMAPAGAINSSANEMAHWLKAWIDEGKYKGEEVIPHSYLQEAISSQMIISNGIPTKEHPDVQFLTYGFGWMMRSYREHYMVEHGGNIDGFSASTCFFPSDSIGIVVLVNQDASSIPAVVRNIVSDKMLGLCGQDWSKETKEKLAKLEHAEQKNDVALATGAHPSHRLQDFEGIYSNPGYGDLEIVLERDSLFALGASKRIWLKHYHYDIFEPMLIKEKDPGMLSEFGVKFNFQTNSSGEIIKILLPLEPSLKPIIFIRKPKIQELTAAE